MKNREQSRQFFENPHRFTRKLFEQSESGEFNIQQELKDHLGNIYSDLHREAPLIDIVGLVRPFKSCMMFDGSELNLPKVGQVINKSRAASAPGSNGIKYKVYKKCEELKKFLWVLLEVVWRQDVVPLIWNIAKGVYIPKEENASN